MISLYSVFLLPFIPNVLSLSEQRDLITRAACNRNPSLTFCNTSDDAPKKEELVIPPPLPRQRERPERRKDDIAELDRRLRQQEAELSPSNLQELHRKCAKFAPIIEANCRPKATSPANVARCKAYFRDCSRFVTQGDPLEALANSFSSGVNVNVATVDVNGIPYYPINEEGGVGVAYQLNAPFGAWGGGYSDHVGVRDYWSQHQEVGANWIEGKYGYKNGWSVPLVQSLGVEGGQHNTVSVPLTGKDAGRVMVDNGYNVGGYYGHNDHVGVDWRQGDVAHTFGVGSPFVGAGFQTGQAVTFPGLDVWQRALG